MLLGWVVFFFFFWFFVLNNIDFGGWVKFNVGGYLVCDVFGFSYNNEYSSLVIFMLMICTYISVMYSFHYFSLSNVSWLLSYIMVSFSLVMIILVMTNSFLVSLIMWEYLGLISYILICFYDNSSSLRGAMVTLVSSRFGDVCFFILVSLYYIGGCAYVSLLGLVVLVIVSTKSALFPFISWLLEAMRAPTPVSSLVHSSTLVASGVWMVGSYYYLIGLGNNSYLVYFFQCCCFLTIVITSVCSLYYSDVKQLVALSTSNNISWVFLILSIGDYVLAFVQLLVHAVSKCLLFTLVGDYISSSYGGQDKNQINTNIYGNVFGLIYLFVLLVGLSGFPFMGLYFSKHVFLDSYTNIGFFSILFLFLVICGFIMSCAYSVRLFIILFGYLSFSVYSLRVDFNMIGLVVMISSIVGNYMCFLIYSPYSFFSFLSFFVLFSLLFGVVVGVVVGCNYVNYRSDWLGNLFGVDFLIDMYNRYVLYIWNYLFLCLFRWEIYMFEFLNDCVSLFLFSYLFKVTVLVVSVFFSLFILFF
uniref:NADH:ubiquinone reductase (H(+)-translocating) n=1 Tax=Schistosoma japonicum TaxID=6182 RepID=A0A0U3U1M2_SCHJA|nr:NADH dehydrogenase subunit 5 [Schistosoma japonicum]ALV84458.1 NADH dehydrogenase subunit 5 [Schistosoma japonicum]